MPSFGCCRGLKLERSDVVKEKIYEDHTGYDSSEYVKRGYVVAFDIHTVYCGVDVMLDVCKCSNCGVEIGGRQKI